MREHLEALGRLLDSVESAAVDKPGAMQLHLSAGEESPVGVVMGEQGRICWATSRYYGSSLGHLLSEELDMPLDTLRELFLDCKSKHRPLGEYLVDSGLVGEAQLRRAMLHQTTSALAALVSLELNQGPLLTTFIPSRRRSYDPAFTFATSELILEAVDEEVECHLEAGRPPETFRKMAGRVRTALCLLEGRGEGPPALPVAASGHLDLRLDEVADLYRAAKSVVRPPTLAVAGIEPYAVLVHHRNRGWLVAYFSPYVCLFEVRHRSEYVRLFSSLLHECRGDREDEDKEGEDKEDEDKEGEEHVLQAEAVLV